MKRVLLSVGYKKKNFVKNGNDGLLNEYKKKQVKWCKE